MQVGMKLAGIIRFESFFEILLALMNRLAVVLQTEVGVMDQTVDEISSDGLAGFIVGGPGALGVGEREASILDG